MLAWGRGGAADGEGVKQVLGGTVTQSPARAFLNSSAPFIFSFSPGLSIISFKHRGPLTLFLKAKRKLRGACLNTSCVMAPILEAFTAYWSSQMGPLELAQGFWGCQATVAEVAISGGDADTTQGVCGPSVCLNRHSSYRL